jgi:hypothetical protein
MTPRGDLIAIFEEVKLLLARSENDFTWSSYIDGPSACAEIDSILEKLRDPNSTARSIHGISSVHFAPTGPMQEASLNSGWGAEFCALAARYDDAISRGLKLGLEQ